MRTIEYRGHKNIVGHRVREARKKLAISQEQLAARLQVEVANADQEIISKIERGQRTVSDYEVCLLAKVLDVTPEWLLEGFNDLFGGDINKKTRP